MEKERVEEIVSLVGSAVVRKEAEFSMVEDTYKGQQGVWIVGFKDIETFFLPRKVMTYFTSQETPAARRFFNRRNVSNLAISDIHWESPDILRRFEDLRADFQEKRYLRVSEKSSNNSRSTSLARVDYGRDWEEVVGVIKRLREASSATNVMAEIFEGGRRLIGRSFPVQLRTSLE